jgi:MFS family permease
LLPFQLLTAAVLFVLAFSGDQPPLSFLFWAILIVNLAVSTVDIATDGYAVSLLHPKERGWGNGIQTGGYFAGFIIGGGVSLIASSVIGWPITFALLGGLVLLCLIPVMSTPEYTPPPTDQLSRPLGLGRFFKRPGIWMLLLVLVLYRGVDGLLRTMVWPMLKDFGYAEQTLGHMTIWGSVATMLGAGIAALLINPLGRRRAALIFGMGRPLAALAYLLLARDAEPSFLIWWVVLFDQAIYGMTTVVIFTVMMDWSRQSQAATDYTMQDSAGVFAMIVGSVLAGILAQATGYVILFGVTAVAAVIIPILFFTLYRTPAPNQ